MLALRTSTPDLAAFSCYHAEMAIGKFTVVGTLGSGANSTILHVRRHADSKQYALKVVPIEAPEDHKYLEQAEHEFKVASMLDHPNLIKIYEREVLRDWLRRVRKVHLLTEFVNGRTLDTFQAIPLPRLVQIFEKVARGLVQMHRRNVFHADLKPNNIMLSRSADVKIIDYGLAWIKDMPKNRVQGTPEYMAPETATHHMVNERTDIYNFGATMYRLVTFRFPPLVIPQGGIKVNAKAHANLLRPARDFNQAVPEALDLLIQRCLKYDAHQRPERMSEVQGTLDHLAEELVKGPEDKLEAMEW